MGDGSPDEAVPRVSVEPLPDGGVRIDDRIDRRNCTVRTDGQVSPTPVDDDRFRYPTDVAFAITTDRMEFLPIGASFVHADDDTFEVELFAHETFPEGAYTVELSGSLKLYLEVTGPITVENEVDEVTLDLATADTVVIGARSYHDRPAATVTTTLDPGDVMAAVSTFGTELQTRSSKRSYPTLRGHPPVLSVGDERSIPPGFEPPDVGVEVRVPPDLPRVLAVAPLAYYLGAPVEPASTPALVVDGDRFPLDGEDGFEATVERCLKRTFFLDCLVRTANQRDVMLYERARLDDTLEIDLAALQGRPAADRLAAYQDVPYDEIEPYVPAWKHAAHVTPTRDGVEALPFLANELAVVRVPDGATAGDGADAPGPSPPASAAETPGRDSTPASAPTAGDVSASEAGAREVVRPPATEAVDQSWVGPGVPIGACKAMPTAYRNRLQRERREDETVEVAVVCNDAAMLEEGDTVRAAYGANQHLPFEVTFHRALDADALGLLFESNLDYVHYVGHVNERGFECTDGVLDVADLDSVGVDIAFLNACRSYEQGFKLVDRGAIATVVTFDEVLDEGALRIGETMARLLNRGFPLRRSLSIARARSIVGSQYLVLGDGNADISQARGLIPWLAAVDAAGANEYRVRITPYPTRSTGMGAQFRPAVGSDPPVYLVPKTLPEVTTTADRLAEYFESDSFPVILDGEFTWSHDAAEQV